MTVPRRIWTTTLLILSYLLVMAIVTTGQESRRCNTNTLQIGDFVEATVTASCDGYWTFTGTSGTNIFIGLRSNDFDVYLNVIGESGEVLRSVNDTEPYGANAIVILELPYSGTFTLHVTNYDGRVGSYSLWLHTYDCDPFFSSIWSYRDFADNSTAQSSPLWSDCPNVTYFIGYQGDSIVVNLSSNDFDTYLNLLSASGSILASNDNSGNGTNSQVSLTLPYTGTYQVQVSVSSAATQRTALAPSAGYVVEIGLPVVTAPTEEPSEPTCGLPTRLAPGANAVVITNPPNRVRTEPGTAFSLIGEIPVNQPFAVLGEAVCADSYTWVYVNYDGLTGWTAEADAATYYLERFVETTPRPCPLATRLRSGSMGQVIDDEANSLRSEPSSAASRILSIPSDGIFDVLEGPACGNGYLYWRVNYENQTGWTAEYGPDNVYWLAPYTPVVQPTPCTDPIPRGQLTTTLTRSERLESECGDAWDFNAQKGQNVSINLTSADNGVSMRLLNPFANVIYTGRAVAFDVTDEGNYQINVNGEAGANYNLDLEMSQATTERADEDNSVALPPETDIVEIIVKIGLGSLAVSVVGGAYTRLRPPKLPEFDTENLRENPCKQFKHYRIKNKSQIEAEFAPKLLAFDNISLHLYHPEREITRKKTWKQRQDLCVRLNHVLRFYRFKSSDNVQIQEQISYAAHIISQEIKRLTKGKSGYVMSIELELEGSEFKFKVDTYRCDKGVPRKVGQQEINEQYKKKIALWTEQAIWIRDGFVWIREQNQWLTIRDTEYLNAELAKFIEEHRSWFS